MYIAESEKFAHITYFFNGGYAQHFCDEKWVKIASPGIKNYEKKPEMSAKLLADYVIGAIKSGQYEFIAMNFANMDMVGHTGDFAAAQKAVKYIDTQMERIVQVLVKNGGQAVVTADHGNIEEMINPNSGEPDTEHSTTPVPFILVNSHVPAPHNLPDGKLVTSLPPF